MSEARIAKNLSSQQWREQLEPFDKWNRRLLLVTFGVLGIPPSYLDMGSGTGAMVNLAREIGIDALGVDLIAEQPDKKADLTMDVNLKRKFAMVTCIEVAEHIPPFYSAIFCGNIARHIEDFGIVVFTAAAPGQGGDGHVNLKLGTEWRTFFWDRRLHYREDLTNRLKLAWQMIPMPMSWLAGNVMVFDKAPLDEE